MGLESSLISGCENSRTGTLDPLLWWVALPGLRMATSSLVEEAVGVVEIWGTIGSGGKGGREDREREEGTEEGRKQGGRKEGNREEGGRGKVGGQKERGRGET